LCKHNPTGIALYGNETWTAVVENPGNDAGMPCFETPAPDAASRDPLEPFIHCGGQGICEEFRPCLLTCAQAAKAAEVQPLSLWSSGKKRSKCFDSGWSACDYGCVQTKISSLAYSDGICHEESRTTRPCHIGACSREDPCRIPFIVHVVFAFRDGSVSKWSKGAQEVLATALSNVVNADSHNPFFTPGDVHVATALPWYQDQDTYDMEGNDETSTRDYGDSFNNVILGLKVVVEISIYNSLSDLDKKSVPLDDVSDGALTTILRNITDLVRGRKRRTVCSSDELFPLAKLALKAKDVISSENFMVSLINEIKGTGDPADTEAFGPITYLTYKASESRVSSVWTIRTGIEEKINFFGPQRAVSAKFFVFLYVLESTVASVEIFYM
jgi:hypothetical protein